MCIIIIKCKIKLFHYKFKNSKQTNDNSLMWIKATYTINNFEIILTQYSSESQQNQILALIKTFQSSLLFSILNHNYFLSAKWYLWPLVICLVNCVKESSTYTLRTPPVDIERNPTHLLKVFTLSVYQQAPNNQTH